MHWSDVEMCPYLFWRRLSPSMRDDSLSVEIQNRMSWVRSFHVFTPYPVHSFVHRVCDPQEMPCVHHIVSCKVSSRQPSARTHVWSAEGSFPASSPADSVGEMLMYWLSRGGGIEVAGFNAQIVIWQPLRKRLKQPVGVFAKGKGWDALKNRVPKSRPTRAYRFQISA